MQLPWQLHNHPLQQHMCSCMSRRRNAISRLQQTQTRSILADALAQAAVSTLTSSTSSRRGGPLPLLTTNTTTSRAPRGNSSKSTDTTSRAGKRVHIHKGCTSSTTKTSSSTRILLSCMIQHSALMPVTLQSLITRLLHQHLNTAWREVRLHIIRSTVFNSNATLQQKQMLHAHLYCKLHRTISRACRTAVKPIVQNSSESRQHAQQPNQ
jgi:hypothetical protein